MRNVKNVMKCICAAYVDSRKKHFEPPHDKTNTMTFVPSEDSDHFVGFVIPWLNFHIETTSETIAYGIVTNLQMRN